MNAASIDSVGFERLRCCTARATTSERWSWRIFPKESQVPQRQLKMHKLQLKLRNFPPFWLGVLAGFMFVALAYALV
jgi:hypothetical protein